MKFNVVDAEKQADSIELPAMMDGEHLPMGFDAIVAHVHSRVCWSKTKVMSVLIVGAQGYPDIDQRLDARQLAELAAFKDLIIKNLYPATVRLSLPASKHVNSPLTALLSLVGICQL